jgi:hypothetical protein
MSEFSESYHLEADDQQTACACSGAPTWTASYSHPSVAG